MTTKLVQKQFLKGVREFELLNDIVSVRIKTPFKEEKITVGLATLDPDPVINNPYLEFYSRVEGGPALSLILDKPNAEEFQSFVDALRQRVLEGTSASMGPDSTSDSERLGGNTYDEPPAFDDSSRTRLDNIRENVDAARLDDAIQMLEKYLVAEDVGPFLSALEALRNEPQNESHMVRALKAFDDLGITQGAVLTYAPYISILLSGKPY